MLNAPSLFSFKATAYILRLPLLALFVLPPVLFMFMPPPRLELFMFPPILLLLPVPPELLLLGVVELVFIGVVVLIGVGVVFMVLELFVVEFVLFALSLPQPMPKAATASKVRRAKVLRIELSPVTQRVRLLGSCVPKCLLGVRWNASATARSIV
jgi:hypothetical protein